jgi:hypothetical protein
VCQRSYTRSFSLSKEEAERQGAGSRPVYRFFPPSFAEQSTPFQTKVGFYSSSPPPLLSPTVPYANRDPCPPLPYAPFAFG